MSTFLEWPKRKVVEVEVVPMDAASNSSGVPQSSGSAPLDKLEAQPNNLPEPFLPPGAEANTHLSTTEADAATVVNRVLPGAVTPEGGIPEITPVLPPPPEQRPYEVYTEGSLTYFRYYLEGNGAQGTEQPQRLNWSGPAQQGLPIGWIGGGLAAATLVGGWLFTQGTLPFEQPAPKRANDQQSQERNSALAKANIQLNTGIPQSVAAPEALKPSWAKPSVAGAKPSGVKPAPDIPTVAASPSTLSAVNAILQANRLRALQGMSPLATLPTARVGAAIAAPPNYSVVSPRTLPLPMAMTPGVAVVGTAQPKASPKVGAASPAAMPSKTPSTIATADELQLQRRAALLQQGNQAIERDLETNALTNAEAASGPWVQVSVPTSPLYTPPGTSSSLQESAQVSPSALLETARANGRIQAVNSQNVNPQASTQPTVSRSRLAPPESTAPEANPGVDISPDPIAVAAGAGLVPRTPGATSRTTTSRTTPDALPLRSVQDILQNFVIVQQSNRPRPLALALQAVQEVLALTQPLNGLQVVPLNTKEYEQEWVASNGSGKATAPSHGFVDYQRGLIAILDAALAEKPAPRELPVRPGPQSSAQTESSNQPETAEMSATASQAPTVK